LTKIREGYAKYDNESNDDSKKGILQKTRNQKSRLLSLYSMHKITREEKQLET